MIKRKTDTPEGKAFWDAVEKASKEVESWPDWKRAGINIANQRSEPRVIEKDIVEQAKELLNLSPVLPWHSVDGNKIDPENYEPGEFWIVFGEEFHDSSLMSEKDCDFFIKSRELLPKLIELIEYYRKEK